MALLPHMILEVLNLGTNFYRDDLALSPFVAVTPLFWFMLLRFKLGTVEF